jgi:hypothetical protein
LELLKNTASLQLKTPVIEQEEFLKEKTLQTKQLVTFLDYKTKEKENLLFVTSSRSS